MLCFLFLSRTLLKNPQTFPLSLVQVCNVKIKEIYLLLWECCRQSVSGRVQSQRGVRALEAIRQTKLFYFYLFFVYWKSKLGGLFIHMFVAALKFTQKHTHTDTLLDYTQNTNTSCIWSLCFLFPRWGCQPCGNDALTNKSLTSMNVGMQHIAIKAPSEMQRVGLLVFLKYQILWCLRRRCEKAQHASSVTTFFHSLEFDFSRFGFVKYLIFVSKLFAVRAKVKLKSQKLCFFNNLFYFLSVLHPKL